jgi:hypothetical protein
MSFYLHDGPRSPVPVRPNPPNPPDVLVPNEVEARWCMDLKLITDVVVCTLDVMNEENALHICFITNGDVITITKPSVSFSHHEWQV